MRKKWYILFKNNLILQSDDSFIWFGTTNGGLNKLDIKLNKFHHLFIEDGLPSNYITAIEKSKDGNIWVSSKNGISLINSHSNVVLNFNLLDGISDLDFFRGSVSKNDRGKLRTIYAPVTNCECSAL